MNQHTATFYVVLGARRSRWRPQVVDSVKASAMRLTKPGTSADEIVVKVSITVPDAAFEPFQLPEVVLDVTPAELTAAVEPASA